MCVCACVCVCELVRLWGFQVDKKNTAKHNEGGEGAKSNFWKLCGNLVTFPPTRFLLSLSLSHSLYTSPLHTSPSPSRSPPLSLSLSLSLPLSLSFSLSLCLSLFPTSSI